MHGQQLPDRQGALMGRLPSPLRRWVLRLLWLTVCVLPVAAHAVGIGNNDSYALSNAFTVLEDPSGQLGIDDILQAQAQARFKPLGGARASTNFGATHSAIWLRVDLHPTLSAVMSTRAGVIFCSMPSGRCRTATM
jgi:hypothetical protein